MDEKLLTIQEASEFLSCSKQTLRSLIDEGKIPFVNVGSGKKRKAIRLQKSALEAFVVQGGVQNG